MIEENAVARKHAIGLAVIHSDVIRVGLCASVGRAWMKRCRFSLRRLKGFAVKLGRRCLIKLRANPRLTNRFQETDGAEPRYLASVFGNVKADANMGLGAKIIDFIRLHLSEDGVERTRVVQISVDEMQARAFLMRVLIQMVDSVGIEGR